MFWKILSKSRCSTASFENVSLTCSGSSFFLLYNCPLSSVNYSRLYWGTRKLLQLCMFSSLNLKGCAPFCSIIANTSLLSLSLLYAFLHLIFKLCRKDSFWHQTQCEEFIDVLLETALCNDMFSSLELPRKFLLQLIQTATFSAAKKITTRMIFKVLRRRYAMEESLFLTIKSLALCELRTKNMRQVLGASLTFHSYAIKD